MNTRCPECKRCLLSGHAPNCSHKPGAGYSLAEKENAELKAQIAYLSQQLKTADAVIHCLNFALAKIESRCGSPGSKCMDQRADIYELARVALEQVGVPGSPLYWARR